jgi:serine/threonine-protein phosphatase 2B catalytic subunit
MKIQEPVCIVGDIHGQYYDMCHMLEKAGNPEGINYLFLGDFVDRGIYGTEVMLLLMSLKITYPHKIVILRGNHESRSMTENFTFRSEVIERYDEATYEQFLEVFDSLPLACVVDDKYLAMHGGISPNIQKIDEINQIDRFKEVPLEGVFCDLLWADPMKDDAAIRGTFDQNKERDCSVYFGKKPLKKLLDRNNLMSIVRGH